MRPLLTIAAATGPLRMSNGCWGSFGCDGAAGTCAERSSPTEMMEHLAPGKLSSNSVL
jgi:hypothetical protein